jgi:hypothetical protein
MLTSDLQPRGSKQLNMTYATVVAFSTTFSNCDDPWPHNKSTRQVDFVRLIFISTAMCNTFTLKPVSILEDNVHQHLLHEGWVLSHGKYFFPSEFK